jgi:hypothetical protein
MRTPSLAFGFFLVAAVDATAQPVMLTLPDPAAFGGDQLRVNLPQSGFVPDRGAFFADDNIAGPMEGSSRPLQSEPLSRSVVTIGPFKLHVGSDGLRTRYAQYDLADTHILGANMSGTFDGRSGTLILIWPTGD